MDSLITELRNLVAIYNNKPNFIFLKALCLITWAIYLLKLSIVPLWLVILLFCLIFICNIIVSYIKIVKAYNNQIKDKDVKTEKHEAIMSTETKQVKTNIISTNK